MLPKNLTHNLDQELEQLWSVWAGLGLYTENKPICASPEACIVGLSCIGHYDQRLFDEALSYIHAHSGIIRIPFINYWMKMIDPSSQSRLALILDFCHLSPKIKTPVVTPPINFFKNIQQTPVFNGSRIDPEFEKYGYLRNPYISSTNVPSIHSVAEINPFVKMRLTSGFQAQSDAWIYLMYYKKLTVPKLQSLLGVTPKSVWNILQSMFQAGWVTKTTMGKTDLYKITPEATKTFSFIKTPRVQSSPVDWVLLGHKLFAVGDHEITDSYYTFLESKLSKELLSLKILAEKAEVSPNREKKI
jgi:hypothetical protein